MRMRRWRAWRSTPKPLPPATCGGATRRFAATVLRRPVESPECQVQIAPCRIFDFELSHPERRAPPAVGPLAASRPPYCDVQLNLLSVRSKSRHVASLISSFPTRKEGHHLRWGHSPLTRPSEWICSPVGRETRGLPWTKKGKSVQNASHN